MVYKTNKSVMNVGVHCSFEETMHCAITDEAARSDGVNSHALFCNKTWRGTITKVVLSIETSTSLVRFGALQRGRGTSDEATSEALYGADFLPLKQFDVITMVTDTGGGTLRYLVNGVDAGVAFGPLGSGAACELEDDKAPFTWQADAVLFPSCSLSNDKQVGWRSTSRANCFKCLDVLVDMIRAKVVDSLCSTINSSFIVQ